MKVLIQGEKRDVPESYGARLIEQGKAMGLVPAPSGATAPKGKGRRKGEDVSGHEPEKPD